jgi:hypothetical protein
MKSRLAILLGVFAFIAGSLALGPAGGVAADDPPPEVQGELDAPYFYGVDHDLPRWLRYSIVYCAAKTMDVEVEHVQVGLRNGHSLKEIGIRAGVRPFQLENGILRCEHHLLERLVNAGDLEPSEARRIHHFLRTHITRIINYTWEG